MARILYVEDNEDNVYMLSRRLQRKGFEVLVARDGEEAVETVLREKPELVLMDLSLPVLDGWEATRRIRAEPSVACTPVIALTAHAMEGEREKALSAGCNDFDTKPVDLPRLLGKIGALLGEA
jgi:two-component system cell cycle response regulator DivK